jgi:hypothetical protein
MAGRNYRFGSLEIIIIFGESLERGALKSPFPKPDTVVGNYTERPVNEENIDIYTFNFTDTNHVFSEFWRFSQNCKGETS